MELNIFKWCIVVNQRFVLRGSWFVYMDWQYDSRSTIYEWLFN